jgi:peptidoglycan hydrolase-like protein with peptidoglycan-binding domain
MDTKGSLLMRRHKLLVFLGSMFLLSILVFTGASSAQAFAASTKAHATQAAASPNVSCPPQISYGNAGTWVRWAQDSLNAQYIASTFTNYPYNFYPYSEANTPLKTDGIFGIDTENATKDFQYAHNLSIDGIIGPHTWHALHWC